MALNGTSLHRLPLLDAAQSSQGAVKRKEIVSRGAIGSPTRLQGHGGTVDVDYRTARATTAGGGICLVVACVEIAIAVSVFRSISIESANNTGENTQLLSSVITDDPDLNTN